MMMTAKCTNCGSKKVAVEVRDWFGDDPIPPREGIGTWLVCTQCGFARPDDDDVQYDEDRWETDGGR